MAGIFDNLFSDALEEEPRAAFFSTPGRKEFSRSPTRQRFFENQFPSVFNEFLGQIGTQLREGQQPDTTFADFVDAIDFETRFRSLPPGFRGFQRVVAPQTRFLVNF